MPLPSSLRRAWGAVLNERNPSRIVYGTLVTGAVLAVESSFRQAAAQAIGALAITLVLYWLAHAYAWLLEERIRRATRLQVREIGRALLHEWPILLGGIVPGIVLVVASLLGAGLRTAEVIAMLAAAGFVVALEVVAGLHAGLRGKDMAVQVVVGAVLGLGIIGLKVLVK